MGYDIYITRAETWLESDRDPISKEEWDCLVAKDPELEWATDTWYDTRDVPKRERLPTGAVVTRPQEDHVAERIFPVIWKGLRGPVALWYEDGAIMTKNPNKVTVIKFVDLAASLGARVLGEEDEQYSADGTATPPRVMAQAIKSPNMLERLSELLSRLLTGMRPK